MSAEADVHIALTREQGRKVYDLVVAKTLSIEDAEMAAQTGLGSMPYREIADYLWRKLELGRVERQARAHPTSIPDEPDRDWWRQAFIDEFAVWRPRVLPAPLDARPDQDLADTARGAPVGDAGGMSRHTAALRLYGPDELGPDGYPPVWHRCPRCKGSGEVGDPEHPRCCGTLAGGCGGSGSLKARVRLEAGNRCVRCLHPYAAGAGEWSACDRRCTHGEPIRVLLDGEVVSPLEAVAHGGYRTEAHWRVLTVHHLDINKANCRWWNLAALCQRCHLQIQGKVQMARIWPGEHSDWFKPYVAGYYAHAYLGADLDRAAVEARLDELLALERAA